MAYTRVQRHGKFDMFKEKKKLNKTVSLRSVESGKE